MGFSGPTGLDYVAVWTVIAPAIDVPVSELSLRLLQSLEGDQLAEWQAEADKARAGQAAAATRPRMR